MFMRFTGKRFLLLNLFFLSFFNSPRLVWASPSNARCEESLHSVAEPLLSIIEDLVKLQMSGLVHPKQIKNTKNELSSPGIGTEEPAVELELGKTAASRNPRAYVSKLLFFQKYQELLKSYTEAEVEQVLRLVNEKVRMRKSESFSAGGATESLVGPLETSPKKNRILRPRIESLSHIAGLRGLGSKFVSPDGERFLTVFAPNGEKSLIVLVEKTGKSIATIVHNNPQVEVSFSEDGRLIASADGLGILKISDGLNGKLKHEVDLGRHNKIQKLQFGPDHTKLLVHLRTPNKGVDALWIFDTERGKLIVEMGKSKFFSLFNDDFHEFSIGRIQFSKCGRFLMTIDKTWTAKLWSLESGRLLNNIFINQSDLNDAHFLPDGNGVVGVHLNGNIEIFGGTSDTEKIDLQPLARLGVDNLQWSPRGQYAIVRTSFNLGGGKIKIFSRENKQFKFFMEMNDVVDPQSIQFSEDERWLMVRTVARELEFYNLNKKRKEWSLPLDSISRGPLLDFKYLYLSKFDQLILSINRQNLVFWKLFDTL